MIHSFKIDRFVRLKVLVTCKTGRCSGELFYVPLRRVRGKFATDSEKAAGKGEKVGKRKKGKERKKASHEEVVNLINRIFMYQPT